MNYFMVKRLILKDWYFQRWPIVAYLAGGALALILLGKGTKASFYAGSILLITVMITVGIMLVMATIVGERSEHTLPFIMTLPVSPKEYTAAKIIANLTIFLIPWAMLSIGTLAVLGNVAPQLSPFALLLLVEMFASYSLLLAVAIVTESQGWTVSVMLLANLFLQAFLYSVSNIPSIARGMKGASAVWDQTVLTLLIVEVATVVLLLGGALLLQARKKDFV